MSRTLVINCAALSRAMLAVLMLLSIIFARGRSCFRLIVKFAVVFALFGGGYLLWHWRYFGDFMPLPFYRKGGWRLYPDSLTESVLGALGFAGPFVFAYLLGLRKPATMRLTLVFSIPIAGFVAIWLLISDEMNFMMRYQYPVLPIILMSWYPLVKSVGDEIQSSRLISFDGWQPSGPPL